MSNPFKLDKALERFKEEVKTKLPKALATLAQNFFAASWKKQGWDDGGLQLWPEVQRRMTSTKAYKYAKASARTRAILVKSGRLRRAVQDSVREISFNRIRFLVDVPYAGYHNKGTDKLPKREFMGDSRTLQEIHRKKIVEAIQKAFKNALK